MMNCSLNEIETLLLKAARGKGADPALAARFARAGVAYICETGQVALIDQALEALPAGIIVEFAATLQKALAEACDVPATLAVGSALELGYLQSLPHKIRAKGDGTYCVHLDVFERLQTPKRVVLDHTAVQRWQGLAAKTFVPESEHSRRAGAGAGLTDND